MSDPNALQDHEPNNEPKRSLARELLGRVGIAVLCQGAAYIALQEASERLEGHSLPNYVAIPLAVLAGGAGTIAASRV